MMRRLDFEFQRPPRRAWPGWALLAMGLFLLAEMGYSYSALKAQLAAAEHEGSASRAKAPRELAQRLSGVAGRDASAGEVAQAVAVLERLALPWEELFAAIERASAGQVALLALQPDAEKGAITLSGEARDHAGMLAYVTRLRQERVFSAVHLASHEVREADPQRPIAFSIAATWRKAP